MEPHSSLVAPAHFAVGKFIFLKPTSTHTLSLAWHQLPQRFVSNVLEKSAIIYILCTEKEVTKKVVCLIQLHFLDLSLFIILSEVLQSTVLKKHFSGLQINFQRKAHSSQVCAEGYIPPAESTNEWVISQKWRGEVGEGDMGLKQRDGAHTLSLWRIWVTSLRIGA